jgi:hypothetical protein
MEFAMIAALTALAGVVTLLATAVLLLPATVVSVTRGLAFGKGAIAHRWEVSVDYVKASTILLWIKVFAWAVNVELESILLAAPEGTMEAYESFEEDIETYHRMVGEEG